MKGIKMNDEPIADTCDNCGYQLDAVSGVDGDFVPKDGDVSVCMKCGARRIFTVIDGNLGRRMPTEEETINMNEDEYLIKLERVRAFVTQGAWD